MRAAGHSFTASLDVKNLTDHEYRDGIDGGWAAPRRIFLSVGTKFQGRTAFRGEPPAAPLAGARLFSGRVGPRATCASGGPWIAFRPRHHSPTPP